MLKSDLELVAEGLREASRRRTMTNKSKELVKRLEEAVNEREMACYLVYGHEGKMRVEANIARAQLALIAHLEELEKGCEKHLDPVAQYADEHAEEWRQQ
jgi:hypothetical protein